MNDSSRHLFVLAALSLGLLVLLSAVPWSRLTGNIIKDFNLFEDLLETKTLAEAPTEDFTEVQAEGGSDGDIAAIADSIEVDTAATDSVFMPVIEEAPVTDGYVMIENYTGGVPFAKFRAALAQAGGRLARVAVVGDSYIEGDIFCQNLREILQQRYGGNGTGFLPVHSDFPGFRKTVRQSDSGWKLHDIRTFARRDSLRNIACSYAKSVGAASASFKATNAFPGVSEWTESRFLFIAPDSCSVRLSTSGASQSFEVSPSPQVQMLSLSGLTDRFEVSTDAPGLVALGVCLDSGSGVQVDCMSVRGNSGMGLRAMNADLCAQMSRYVGYDLIILEFGMNAITPGQNEYEGYYLSMQKAIAKVRACYPEADILVMGVGDRGVKNGTAVESLSDAKIMGQVQRRLARKTGTLFWDTRAAMGGDGAVAEWRKRKLVNADYIHLNHDGGAELARLFDKALQISLNE